MLGHEALDDVSRAVKRRLRYLLAGTPLERPARFAWERLTGARPNRHDLATEAIVRARARPDWHCVDVGANVGDIADVFIRACPAGRHVLVEPLPGCVALLRRKYRKQKNIEIIEAALAEEAGQADFRHNQTHPAQSGLRQQNYFTTHNKIEIIKVDVQRLDDIVLGQCVDFVKIDVEGGELGVLRGGYNTMTRHRPIVLFEHSRSAAPFYGYGPKEIFMFFAELEYNLHVIDELLTNKPALDIAAFVDTVTNGSEWCFAAAPRPTRGDAANADPARRGSAGDR